VNTKKRKKKTTKSVGRTTKNLGDEGWVGLFASPTMARLLTLFLTRAEQDYYQKELARRELARLERTGLVTRMPRGNRVYYRANRKHPVFEDLKRVILKTVGLGDALRAALAALTDRVRVAFIYGSFAQGEETAESDIDVLLVGDLSLREASAVLGPVGRKLGREFNPAVYPPEEFQAKAAKGHHFITEVLKGEKIYLVGDEHELRRIVG